MRTSRTLYALLLTATFLALAAGTAAAQTTSSTSATQASATSSSTDLDEGTVFGAIALNNAAGTDIGVSDVSDRTLSSRSATTASVQRDLDRDDVFLALALGAGNRDDRWMEREREWQAQQWAAHGQGGGMGRAVLVAPSQQGAGETTAQAEQQAASTQPPPQEPQPTQAEQQAAQAQQQPAMACPAQHMQNMQGSAQGDATTGAAGQTACPHNMTRPVVILVMVDSDRGSGGQRWSLLGRSLDLEEAGFNWIK